MKDFEDLVKTIVNLLDDDEQDRLREMEDWIIKDEGTWVLAEGFIPFLAKVLTSKDIPSEGKIALMRYGILFPKLFWPTLRKKCSSYWEKLLKFEAEGQEFAKCLKSHEQFIQAVKGQNNFW